jgi:hypothetical protein
MAICFFVLSLLTCHRESDGKSSEVKNCFAQDVADGVELVCDGVPHLIKHGKEGPAGRNGSPGQRGDPGAKGDQGPPGNAGRTVKEVMLCHLSWDGVPAYEIDYQVFDYSDGVREASAIVETDKGEIWTNSAIYIKEDPRISQAQLDIGGFAFTKTSGGAVVLYRSTGRTDNMDCK